MKSLAPDSMASAIRASWPRALTMTTLAAGSMPTISLRAVIPSIRGMTMSMVVRSGRNSRYRRTASTPLSASPTTTKGPRAKISRIMLRMKAASSITRMVKEVFASIARPGGYLGPRPSPVTPESGSARARRRPRSRRPVTRPSSGKTPSRPATPPSRDGGSTVEAGIGRTGAICCAARPMHSSGSGTSRTTAWLFGRVPGGMPRHPLRSRRVRTLPRRFRIPKIAAGALGTRVSRSSGWISRTNSMGRPNHSSQAWKRMRRRSSSGASSMACSTCRGTSPCASLSDIEPHHQGLQLVRRPTQLLGVLGHLLHGGCLLRRRRRGLLRRGGVVLRHLGDLVDGLDHLLRPLGLLLGQGGDLLDFLHFLHRHPHDVLQGVSGVGQDLPARADLPRRHLDGRGHLAILPLDLLDDLCDLLRGAGRSEERRVGKECR